VVRGENPSTPTVGVAMAVMRVVVSVLAVMVKNCAHGRFLDLDA
jgi:hypothetical protein